MADVTINGLTTYATPQAGDFIGVWDIATSQYKKTTRSNLIGVNVTGGGTISLGGFTLTVPASGTAALLERANVFTAAQEINLATNATTLTLDTGAGATAAAVTIQENNTDRMTIWTSAVGVRYLVSSINHDLGTNPGVGMVLASNSNATTPAAAFIRLNTTNSWRAIWVDTAGNLRINSALPTNANDVAGTVVGAQTSSLDAKLISGPAPAAAEVLGYITQAAEAVRRFVYKGGSFGGEEFTGLVTDFAPRYGMDRDEDHPAGKSLNLPNAIGDLMIAVADLAKRLAELEGGRA